MIVIAFINKNIQFHRKLNKPVIFDSDGYLSYYMNNIHHRTNGPAMIYPNGTKRYYLNGILYSEEDYYKTIKSLK